MATNVEGAGALRAPLADMVKLAEALAGRRDTPLKETIALALEPMRPGLGSQSTGYAWITTKSGDTRVVWHNGATAGFHSMIVVNRDTRTAAVVLVDSATSFDDLAIHLADPVEPLVKKRPGIFQKKIGIAGLRRDDMGSERGFGRAQRPDVEVVHRLDTIQLREGQGDLINVDALGYARERHPHRFLEEANAAPQDDECDR